MSNLKRLSFIYSLTIFMCVSIGSVNAQAQQSIANQTRLQDNLLSRAELEALVAPIALYPDDLLFDVLTASTYPLQVIQAQRWYLRYSKLSHNQLIALSQQESWDPSVKVLLGFPDLLTIMSDDLRWLESLGNAYSYNTENLYDAIDILRQHASHQGYLKSNNYVHVGLQHSHIVINSIGSGFVYLPFYNTQLVFGHWNNRFRPYNWRSPGHFAKRGAFRWGPKVRMTRGVNHKQLKNRFVNSKRLVRQNQQKRQVIRKKLQRFDERKIEQKRNTRNNRQQVVKLKTYTENEQQLGRVDLCCT